MILWRTDAGQWFVTREEAEFAALDTPTRRFGPVPIPATDPAGMVAWLNAWTLFGDPVKAANALAGVSPAERGRAALLPSGPAAIVGGPGHGR
jgi:hypothetical protein